METKNIEMPVDVADCTPKTVINYDVIRWTRQADDSYQREGILPAQGCRIYVIDQDYKTNPNAVCPGQKLWLKEEAVALVERKVAEGSYKAWRYEIRPEISSDETPPGPNVTQPDKTAVRICSNQRCKKGPNGTPGMVKGKRAKYCCNYCRVDVSRRSRPKSEQAEERKRKRRRDAKYASHAERQRAYQAKRSTSELPQGIRDLLWMKARRARVPDSGVQEPA